MKKKAIIVLTACLIPAVSIARDFTVRVVHENYREEGEQIYHSVQVDSIAGNKILVLKGNNDQYRNWFREYMASNNTFVAVVPDEDSFKFISSKVYNIDIDSVHPLKKDQWEKFTPGGATNAGMDENQILVVDGNMERRRLVRQVVEQLGYAPRVFSSGKEAYDFFRLQPEQFHMIITSNKIEGLKVDQLVEKCIRLSPGLPVMVGAGYNQRDTRQRLLEHFSGMENVYVKPVILDNLTKSIVRILRKKKA
ncbi:MAG: response regulator [Desulfarculaceae bacterium]|nr:response regulator [Desulfarculaceae bacterium]